MNNNELFCVFCCSRDRKRQVATKATPPAEVIPSASLPFVSPDALPKKLSMSEMFLGGSDRTFDDSTTDGQIL